MRLTLIVCAVWLLWAATLQGQTTDLRLYGGFTQGSALNDVPDAKKQSRPDASFGMQMVHNLIKERFSMCVGIGFWLNAEGYTFEKNGQNTLSRWELRQQIRVSHTFLRFPMGLTYHHPIGLSHELRFAAGVSPQIKLSYSAKGSSTYTEQGAGYDIVHSSTYNATDNTELQSHWSYGFTLGYCRRFIASKGPLRAIGIDSGIIVMDTSKTISKNYRVNKDPRFALWRVTCYVEFGKARKALPPSTEKGAY
jgi:hypothetical protein